MAEVHLDAPVLLFTLIVSLTTGILFGLAPAFTVAQTNPHGTLKEGGRGGSATASSQRLRSALVVIEIALSLTLLAGAGLLIRSFLRLQDVDAGFRPEGVLTLRLALPEQKYATAHQSITFYRNLLDRLRHLPGVDAAGAINGLPLTDNGWSGSVTIDTTAVTGPDASPEADQRPITPGYFEALHIPLLQGRYPTDQDNETAAPICLVDETLARKYWPNSDPLGHRLHRGGTESKSPWMTVIGVLRPVRYRTLESPSRVAVYWPHAQSTFPINTLSLAVHTTADPKSLIGPIRQAVLAQDPDQPIYRIQTLSAVVGESLSRRRLSMLLLAIFAGAALFLAGIGLHGLISQSVAQRSHELGIRLALGARRAELLRLVLGQSAVLATGGILLGLASSMLLTRFITTLLFAVNPYDPLTFVAVAGLLLLISGAAALAPAYRASTVDPVEVLRKE
jgi:putative ABC transport system permease protein